MSNNRRKYNHARNPFRWPPGFKTYWTIGSIASKRLPAFNSWAAVGRNLGMSKQKAWHCGNVALGKLLYRIAAIIQEEPEL